MPRVLEEEELMVEVRVRDMDLTDDVVGVGA